MKQHLLNFHLSEFQALLESAGFPGYRGEQIFKWIFHQGAESIDAMSNLPKSLRNYLTDHFSLYTASLVKVTESEDGTLKVLLKWPDEKMTETVMIPDRNRMTVCVSSQVGCPVKCKFCASGLEGLERSLKTGEIVEQLLWIKRQLNPEERISNVVMMGMGEPLANYQQMIKAVKTMNAPWGLGIGARHITVSSVGLVDRIKQLADEPLQLTLAISLHAGNEEVRQDIIPWASRTSTKELFEAIDYFYQKTHREVTLEYIMLDGVNNSKEDADKLAYWSKRSRCNVNLINYNEVDGLPYKRANTDHAKQFKNWLIDKGVNAHIRPSRGRDVDAACGQLRRRYVQNNT